MTSKKVFLFLVIFLFYFSFVFSQSFQPPAEVILPNTITIIAEGVAESEPDIATFGFDIQTKSSKVGRSQRYNVEKTQKVINTLNKFGIERKDIKTVGFRIDPYDGYTTTHRLKIILRDIEKIEEILEEILKLGITNLSEIKYEVEDLDRLRNKAYEKAIQVASERARVLANAGGFKIGRIISIKEQPDVTPQIPFGPPPHMVLRSQIQPEISGAGFTSGAGSSTEMHGKTIVSTPEAQQLPPILQPGIYEVKVGIIVVYEIER